MLDTLAAPEAALALALMLFVATGAAGVLRTWRHPDQCAGLCVVLLVLILTMATSVVVFEPLQAGDLVEEPQQR
jgi:hypothetical protein